MANKEALRELQGRLAERLQAARSIDRPTGWLAVEAGGHAFLLPLAEAGEIFPSKVLVPVPHTLPWFIGVANLRGTLAGVVDLARFLGLPPAPAHNDAARVVAFNPVLDINVAVRVDRLAGLRNPDQLSVEPPAPDAPAAPAFVGRRLRDDSGRLWQELRLAELGRDERFLHIVD
jgi:twitching motility protein PilI